MYFKLSLRNVKRSFKDYAIYFLTITFAVCLFYSFNSISAQKAMLDLSSTQSDMIDVLMRMIGAISVFISVVLAFLILFANRFLIKRRQKELGMYMTLGMSKYHISRILVMETFFIGLMSLAVGLGLGVLLSQGLSVLTGALFKVDMNAYEFVFSTEAMIKTVIYFGIIFLVVMVTNILVMSRYKLIDLLTASRKNQKLKLRKTSTAVIVFISSLILLGIAYGMMLEYGLFYDIAVFWVSIALGAVGTFLFFFSLSGFLLNVLKKNEKLYYNHINMFVLRQINSKVNSTFISMTIICLMLFFTIGVLSTGFSLKESLEKELDQTTPYDATLYDYVDGEEVGTLKEAFNNLELNEYGDTIVFTRHRTDERIINYLKPYSTRDSNKFLDQDRGVDLEVMKRSDYEELVKMQGKEPISLKGEEVLLLTNRTNLKESIRHFVEQEEKIKIRGESYPITSKGMQMLSTKTDSVAMEFMTAVLPDEMAEQLPVFSVTLNVQYEEGKQGVADEKVQEARRMLNQRSDLSTHVLGTTKTGAYERSTGTSAVAVYIGVYLGIVFLISSAAILALQQLSEASENMERYSMLKKIGVTQKGVHQSIFKQVFVYFMMPLALAIIHSIFGIKVVNDALLTAGQSSVLLPSFITAGVIIIVYGGYFLATYSGYKSIVK
ncbi:ABC transporter permease [Pontibacillus salipaludis]|uniref:ABC transporter permease n=1 Tax=Pontibacillus salipaludis TaxID=1697394 RepID=A0ABQ1Q524_9BACI|nr:ABC transporter permease [Pontibacillus salipaludis]GGD12525.1 ABC transporter permease [Pontibacillus salipaludis]